VEPREDRQKVFTTPIFFKLLRGLLVMCVMLGLLSSNANAGDGEDSKGGFFSYLPAVPKLKLPNIDIVPFWTDDLKKGKRAFSEGDFPRALEYFQKSSDDGNTIADWYLGHMYRLGRGVTKDQAVAFSYYQRVAEGFDPEEQDKTRLRIAVDAQLRVADYQRSGLPKARMKPNPQLATRTYLRLATSYAHPGALYALGVMSIEGEGMDKNPQQGLKWLNAAVRKRSPEAAAYLAELYESGRVVKHDETRALMWYTIAAESGSQEENPFIFSRLENLRSNATEEVRLEAEARARVWSEQNPASSPE
jgi:TPR repeat protein